MEYQVFALKWRPQYFDEVVGQEHIIANLKNAILKKRIPHAFLFCGPHGVGKTSTARILAKSLNCKEGPTVKPCQKCSNCIEITQSRNIDVIEIDGASNRGIDEIRTLRENVKFPPTNSRYKIYIIDEVHMLTTEAFNALLKTLEEPPPFVKFIFATTQPHKVMPTILSRCQRFYFKRIPINKIIEQLKKIILEQNIEIDEEILLSLARASQGSLRDAELILDQLISLKKDKLSLEDVTAVLGIMDMDVLFSLTDRIIHKDPKGIIEFLNKVVQEGKDLSLVISGLIEHFRNLLIVKISKEDFSILDLPLDICQRLFQQSQYFSVDEIIHFFNTLINIQEMTKKLDFLNIPLEVGLIKLCHEKKIVLKDKNVMDDPKISEFKKDDLLKESIQIQDNEIKNNPTPTQEFSSNKISPNNNYITIEQIREGWDRLVEELKKKKMSVASYLQEGIIRELNGDVLLISFAKDNSFHKEVLETKENKALIEKTIESIFNVKIRLSFNILEETHKKEDSFVKTIIETFNAKPIHRE